MRTNGTRIWLGTVGGILFGLVGALGVGTQSTGCSGEEAKCDACAAANLATWNCFGATGFRCSVCHRADAASHEVQSECLSECTILSFKGASLAACENTGWGGESGTGGTAPNCTNWDPASEITFTSGVYHVDGDFLDSLIANPSYLTVCDDARWEPRTAGGYELADASSGEMLYELGWRNGDVPVMINGQSLDDWDGSAAAFALYFVDEQTQFTARLWRSGNLMSLAYEID